MPLCIGDQLKEYQSEFNFGFYRSSMAITSLEAQANAFHFA
jgi:hypothetical protein